MSGIDALTPRSGDTIFYGWWIVLAAFLNLFFSVGTVYYGFPVFYQSLIADLGFSRSEVTQGFLLGALIIGLPAGLAAGTLIDKYGARQIILAGVGLIGAPLILMGFIHHLWQYEVLCGAETLGYTLAGPIANQVLVARWFSIKRGRAMGYAYLGLGLGGVIAPPTASWLIRHIGWRSALETIGSITLLILFPIGIFVTRSDPADKGLLPDGVFKQHIKIPSTLPPRKPSIAHAIRTLNFWLLLAGSTLVMGSINTVIQHFVLLLRDKGYTVSSASLYSSLLLTASLGGRILVGYLADRFMKKNIMTFFYMSLALAIPLLILARHPLAAFSFAIVFGISMGADYMLIPLVTAECFGIETLGKLLALIIMGCSIAQWSAPWVAGKIFDATHTYHVVWILSACAAATGAVAIFFIRPSSNQIFPDEV